MYTCPETKNLEETPYYGRESFFGVEARLSHFVLQVKRRCQGPEVKQPFHLYWWAELNFGQETAFLEASVLKAFLREAVFYYYITLNLFSAACRVWNSS